MFCTNCGNQNTEIAQFCTNCGAPLNKSVSEFNSQLPVTKQVGKWKKVVSSVVGVVAFLVVFGVVRGIVSNSFSTNNQQEATNILKDSLNNTNSASPENAKYTQALRQVFDYYRQEGAKLISTDKKIANSNVLELESYKSIASINSHIATLKIYIQELNSYEVQLNEIRKNARNVFKNSDLSEKEIQDVLQSFDNSANDQTQQQLRIKRMTTLKIWAQKTLELYEFMLANYNDFEIQLDETGEEKIYFAYDSQITEYQNLATAVDTASSNFQTADNEFRTYTDNKLKQSGLDITTSDIESSLYK